jgi:branched-chain amino acid transport system ATP-binding protein
MSVAARGASAATTSRPGDLMVRGLTASYGAGDVLHRVDLRVEAGKLTVVLGPNGAGKSTLLHCMLGLLKPRSGTIELDGRRVDGMSPARIARRGVALVPEGRRLFGPESVADNLWVGGWVRGRARAGLEADRARMYERFPILGRRRKEPAASLSGGEAQMLAIAMALMARPSVLLLDEPSLGLAPKLVTEVMELVSELTRQGVTVLLVEQMVNKALAVSDWAIVLGRGSVVASGTPREVAAHPLVKATYLGSDAPSR